LFTHLKCYFFISHIASIFPLTITEGKNWFVCACWWQVFSIECSHATWFIFILFTEKENRVLGRNRRNFWVVSSFCEEYFATVLFACSNFAIFQLGVKFYAHSAESGRQGVLEYLKSRNALDIVGI